MVLRLKNITPIGTGQWKVDLLRPRSGPGYGSGEAQRRPAGRWSRTLRPVVHSRPSPFELGDAGSGRLLLILGLALILALAVFFATRGGPEESNALQVDSPVTHTPVANPESSAGQAPASAAPRSPGLLDTMARPPRGPRPDVKRSFAGTGTLRGEVTTAPGIPFPSHWTMEIGPSQVLAGKDLAATRTLEFSQGERMFHIPDVPLAGYSLIARSADMTSRTHNVLLVEGRADSFVVMRLEPAGFLDGTVFDAEGRPAEGLKISLLDESSSRRLTATVDAAGGYLFPAVPDGEYSIVFGPPTSPLADSRQLSFRAPAMHFPKTTIPVTGTVVFMVQELDGRPVPDARLRGFGSNGGVVDTTAGYDGWVTVRFLPPGRYSVNATSSLPDGNQRLKGRATFELQSTAPDSVYIHMRP